MYNVYFDNILQDAKDIININDSFETSIVREDGFSGTEQIIREKSETLLQFTGQAYKYVNSIMKENPCAEIQFKIEDSECGYIYNGIIPVTSVEYSSSSGRLSHSFTSPIISTSRFVIVSSGRT